ncbi:flagellar motor protein MotB [Micavibrio aeruginosavorus]|nr:flagellar motor protein MotB [Micavibrio aeruginosavorus]
MMATPPKRTAKHAFDVAGAPKKVPRRSNRRMGDAAAEGNPFLWLTTFTDVMALMLTFFVLLFAMSEPEKKSFSEITSALQQEFNRFYGAQMNAGPEETINIAKINFDQALDIRYLQALIQSVIDRHTDLAGRVVLIPRYDSLIISLPEDLLFEPGQASVKDEGGKALYSLAATLARIKNKITLVGHADPSAMDTAKDFGFTTNWDVSMARAAAVAAILDNVGYTYPVTIQGAGRGRYDDIGTSLPEDRRLDLSRRVDIVIMNYDWRAERVYPDSAFP